jgi:small ligand-binding sensory domain FIST
MMLAVMLESDLNPSSVLMPSQMNQFFTCHSTHRDFPQAVRECLAKMRDGLQEPNLVIWFYSGHADDEAMAEGLTEAVLAYPDAAMAGCDSMATICNEWELEETVALVVWAARFEDCRPEVVHLQYQRTNEGAAFAGFPSLLDQVGDAGSASHRFLIALADPFTFPMDLFLNRLNEEHPGLKVSGGMASAANSPGDTRLIINRQIVNHGAAIIVLDTQTTVATVVSQGCRPIGHPLVITKAERNQIFELGGHPAVEQFLKVYQELPTTEQRILQNGLHLGVAISEYREKFGYGDFLIRNVMQVNQMEGVIVVNDFLRVGQTVQFHLRDDNSADFDLRQLLKASLSEWAPAVPAAGLVFTCNGRGLNLFPDPHHDAALIQQQLGQIPVAGFFAAGEVGAVNSRNFIHGFTASVVWFS